MYDIIERGPHHRVIKRLTIETNIVNNHTVIRTNSHSYIDMETGMHRKNSKGEFVEASDGIAPAPGGAATTNSAHEVFFEANANSETALRVTMPDGKTILKSHVAGLRYFEKETGKNAIIAELADSVGQIVSANEVLYTNALIGDCTADIHYHNTKAGIEQDIILRSQPPDPAAYAMSNAILQVWTEFVERPEPKQFATAINSGLEDEQLDFGDMKMGPGEAFAVGGKSSGRVRVAKQWVEFEGRTFLIEQIPLNAVRAQLQELPRSFTIRSDRGNGVSLENLWPNVHSGDAITNAMQIARLEASQTAGFLLDYNLVTAATNVTFQADMTYYVTGSVILSGNTVFEGGCVIKYNSNAAIVIYPLASVPTITCRASAYRPIILTAKDDQSVGETISGSTNAPSGYYANPAIYISGLNSIPSLNHLRISYAQQGLSLSGSADISDAQFVNCVNPMSINTGTVPLRNALICGSQTNLILSYGGTVFAENVTFSGISCLSAAEFSSTGGTLTLTNCILADVTNLTFGDIALVSGSTNGFWRSPTAPIVGYVLTNTFYPFQTVGGGHYYLTNGCSFIGAGTTNITASLLSSLGQKTTHPPVVQAGGLLTTTNLTLSPQVQREADSVDLGYAYDPIDYEFGAVSVTNAVTVTVTPGTVIAGFGTNGVGRGLTIANGAQFLAQGTPTQPVRVVEYSTVQEQAPVNWGMPFYSLITDDIYENGSPPPAYFNCRFTDFSSLAKDAPLLGLEASQSDVRDCQFHGGYYAAYARCSITNCLFERVENYTEPQFTNGTAVIENCLYYGGTIFCDSYTGTNLIANTLFDRTQVNYNDPTNRGGFNAFVTNYSRIQPTSPSDIILANTDYVPGPLGQFYYPTNGGNLSRLINAGSTNAYYVGLYHFTVVTNFAGGLEINETNSVVDVGFHYVALDSNGNPTDRHGDGIPDYLDPDTDGDGLTDAEELQIWIDTNNQALGHLDPSNPDTGSTGFQDGDKDSDHDGLSNLAELRVYHSDPCNAYTHCCLLDAYYYHTAVAELVGYPPLENQRAKARLFLTPGTELGFTISGASPFSQYDLYFTTDVGALNDLTKRWKFRRVYSGIQCDGTGQATFKIPQPDPNQGYFVVLSAEDSDGDGLTDGYEAWFTYNGQRTYGQPLGGADSDLDGMNDGWEVEYGLDPTVKATTTTDSDSDGQTDISEYNSYNQGSGLNPEYDPLRNLNTQASRQVVTVSGYYDNNPPAPAGQPHIGHFTLTRSAYHPAGTTDPIASDLTVYYCVGGNLNYENGDYTLDPPPPVRSSGIDGTPRIFLATIPAGFASTTIKVTVAANVVPVAGVGTIVIAVTPFAVTPDPLPSVQPDPNTWGYVVDCRYNRTRLSFAQGVTRNVPSLPPGPPNVTYTTIQAAFDASSPGDTILVEDGTYNENIWLHYTHSGSASASTAVRAVTPGRAVIDPNGGTANGGVGFYIDAKYVLVQGFEIKRAPNGGISLYTVPGGIESGSHNKILNNHIHNNGYVTPGSSCCGQDGIYSSPGTSDNQYIANYVHNNGRPAGDLHQGLDHGIYVSGVGELVANNLIVGNSSYGIQISGATETVASLRIYNNTIVSNLRGGIVFYAYMDDIDVANNIIYGHTYGINTCETYRGGNQNPVLIRKNVFFSNQTDMNLTQPPPTERCDPGIPLGIWVDFRKTCDGSAGTTDCNIYGDPKFFDPATDWHLKTGVTPPSVAIRAGLNFYSTISTDYESNPRPQSPTPFDVGAYQTQ